MTVTHFTREGRATSSTPRGEERAARCRVEEPVGRACGRHTRAAYPRVNTRQCAEHTNQLRPMLAEPALGATSQPRMVAATAAWEASESTPGRLLHSSVIHRGPSFHDCPASGDCRMSHVNQMSLRRPRSPRGTSGVSRPDDADSPSAIPPRHLFSRMASGTALVAGR